VPKEEDYARFLSSGDSALGKQWRSLKSFGRLFLHSTMTFKPESVSTVMENIIRPLYEIKRENSVDQNNPTFN
jgi:hypothetical protein